MARTDELTQRTIDAIRPAVEGAGLFLENAAVGRAGQQKVVRVTVDLPDGPGGVGSDALTEVSRAVAAVLDDVDLVEGAYTLEVSTPGAERTLTEPRHFRRAQGRLVEVVGTDGSTTRGHLVAAEGDRLTLEVEGTERHIPMSDVAHARVRVELNRDSSK